MRIIRNCNHKLEIRIGFPNLGNESLGPWYGGDNAIRVKQFHDIMFSAYALDSSPDGDGTRCATKADFKSIAGYFPSIQGQPMNRLITKSSDYVYFDIAKPELDALMICVSERATTTCYQHNILVMFGDFDFYTTMDNVGTTLFHWGGNTFNAFVHHGRTSFAAIEATERKEIRREFPSATFKRVNQQVFVTLSDCDVVMLRLAARKDWYV